MIPYWQCSQCDWIGQWGEAHESISESWDGEVVFLSSCPRCGNEVKHVENDLSETNGFL